MTILAKKWQVWKVEVKNDNLGKKVASLEGGRKKMTILAKKWQVFFTKEDFIFIVFRCKCSTVCTILE